MANLPKGMPFPCGMCGIYPGPPAEGPCGSGDTARVSARSAMWLVARVAFGPSNAAISGIKLPRTFLGSACPGQLATHPRWRGLENARVGLLPLINSREAISISCGAVSIRVINSPSRSAVGQETRKPKPKQARTAPKTQQPREAERGRKHKRKPQEEAKQKTKP